MDHLDSWVDGCDKLKIKITAVEAMDAVNNYRERAGTQGACEPGGMKPVPKRFSSEAFVDGIVEWIVTDDQV